MTVASENNILSDENIWPDLALPVITLRTLSTMRQQKQVALCQPVKNRIEIDAIQNQLFPNEPLNWPAVDNLPINEYQTSFLATLAFPTLFPTGKGDPNPSLLKDIPLSESKTSR